MKIIPFDSAGLPDASAPGQQDRAHVPARHARLDVVCAADIKPELIEWLWPNRIAVGKATAVAGNGGLGKSTLLCDWTARVTTGNAWPDGAAAGPIGNVIFFTSEDGLADTLVPRLIAAGADMQRIRFVRGSEENERKRGFNLQTDLAILEDEIRKFGDVRLVNFDPVTSYLGKTDSHKNSDVRSVLDPLAEMADRMRVAVIANNHLNKGNGSANSRIIGSVAFVNHARLVLIVMPDESDKTRKLLLPSKSNIGPEQYGLAYRIEGCLIPFGGKEIPTSRIMYERDPVKITADQAMAASDDQGETRTGKEEAIDFLTGLLSDGPVAARDIKRKAADDGISWASIRRAQKSLGIKPARDGFGADGRSIWSLP
jgi:putative DNA primase/helicase